jgi:serine/threonine-protein kinase
LSYHSSLGRYELIGQLATGGMAEIHLARLAGEAGFEKVVVVKRLLPELVASKAFVAMFLDEAKLVARLDHPNVCEVYELGRDGAEYFIVMPFLDGIPASALHADPRVAAGVVVQACAGLHYAHELRGGDGASLGLVHRDVSPSNLFVTAAGAVKVLDFGVAKVRGANETEVGTIKGKTQYMAPEQVLAEPLDRRCDVFALGIVLWELVTRRRLFDRASDFLVAKAILEEPIPRADADAAAADADASAAVPRELADVIARALERDRDKRFADARELARAIEQAMAGHGGIASSDEIADALRSSHGDALEAQRTRQLRVVADARSRADGQSPTGAKALGTGVRGAGSADDDASIVATAPRVVRSPPSRVRRSRIVALGAAVVAALAGGIVAWQLSGRASEVRSPDSAVRGSDVVVQSSDVRGSDVRGSDVVVQGSDAVDTDPDVPDTGVRGSAGRGSDVRRPDARHPVPPREKGTFSVDSTPFATIYIDGRMIGMTPMIHKPLPAGHHKLRAALKDGRTKELSLDIPAGKPAPPINLTW